MQRTVSSIDRHKLGTEVAQLEALGLNELRARWRQLYETAPPPRFMRFKTEAEACCSGTSMYEQILSWAAIVSSSRPVILLG